MILRVFRARIREGKEAEFRKLVREQSIPLIRRQDGMSAYFPGAPIDGGGRDFVMVSVWRNVEALKVFAGENWTAPVVTTDEAPLVEEMSAEHYEVVDVK